MSVCVSFLLEIRKDVPAASTLKTAKRLRVSKKKKSPKIKN